MPPPPRLDYNNNVYLHITSPTAPPTQTLSVAGPSNTPSNSTQMTLEYVSQVGELSDEHIFAVRPFPESASTTRDDAHEATGTSADSAQQGVSIESLKTDKGLMGAIMTQVRQLEGVKGVQVLQEKQRTKRDL